MPHSQLSHTAEHQSAIAIERINAFTDSELADLCQATEDAIRDGIGFNWALPPSRDVLESYWKGVLLVPERIIFGGWLDGTLAGSIQLIKPGKSKQTTAFSADLTCHFVAPWARGHGMARALLHAAETEARKEDFSVLNLSVRATQKAAIQLYEEEHYTRWGILPAYEQVDGHIVSGQFFYKDLRNTAAVA